MQIGRGKFVTMKVRSGAWLLGSQLQEQPKKGTVVKGVDRSKWITISKVAVPLGIGTAMAAEVMGAGVLTGILDLVLHKSLSVKNISQCIDAMVKKYCVRVPSER